MDSSLAPNPEGVVAETTRLIRDRLMRGLLTPGQRLVEVDLIRDLGVGRNSLREALQRLATEGLVVIVRNRGAVVRRLSRREIIELSEIRALLEGAAAAAAARRMDQPEARARFIAATAEPGEGDVEPHAYHRVNLEYHRAILAASGNRQLALLVDRLNVWLAALQFRDRFMGADRRRSIDDHRVITQAILAMRPLAARRAMRRHILASTARILTMPDAAFEPERPSRSD